MHTQWLYLCVCVLYWSHKECWLGNWLSVSFTMDKHHVCFIFNSLHIEMRTTTITTTTKPQRTSNDCVIVTILLRFVRMFSWFDACNCSCPYRTFVIVNDWPKSQHNYGHIDFNCKRISCWLLIYRNGYVRIVFIPRDRCGRIQFCANKFHILENCAQTQHPFRCELFWKY